MKTIGTISNIRPDFKLRNPSDQTTVVPCYVVTVEVIMEHPEVQEVLSRSSGHEVRLGFD